MTGNPGQALVRADWTEIGALPGWVGDTRTIGWGSAGQTHLGTAEGVALVQRRNSLGTTSQGYLNINSIMHNSYTACII